MAVDENMNAWLADVREKLKSFKAKDEGTDEELSRFFAKWGTPVNLPKDDTKSRVLDSTELEQRYAVDRLTKKPDGTTVVRYYFSNDSAEANALSLSDPLIHSESAPFRDDHLRKLARETMKNIVAESGAKIRFEEVTALDQADITFVQSPHPIVAGDVLGVGAAGRANNKNFVDAMDEQRNRQMTERAFALLLPNQQDKAKSAILKAYGAEYERGTDIFTILASEAEKKLFAHEIEHILGAKHPDTADPQVSKETIMRESALAGLDGTTVGKTLGSLDVDWYQRHFGVKDLPGNTLPAPPVTSNDKPIGKKAR